MYNFQDGCLYLSGFSSKKKILAFAGHTIATELLQEDLGEMYPSFTVIEVGVALFSAAQQTAKATQWS